MGQVVKSSRLRSRLLVGVAAVAVAAPVAGKAVAQDAKWQPWLEAGGQVGTSRSFGDVDMFIPVWQDQTSLLFGDLRGKFSTDPTQEGNFGLGYRTQVDPEWILGGYGYFDIQNSQNDNLFYQATLGIEALSVDWDFRLNGYIPFNSGGQTTNNNNGDLKISGNTIGITHDEEKSLYGFDGEVGWRLPIFPADGDMDVRAFIGGYYFTNSDVDTVAGPRGRLEVRLYDLDFLGVQSRLTVDGEVQWDSPRGTQAFGGLELRIPLGVVTGDAGPKLSPLDRRMVDRVQRDVDIVTRQFQSNPDSVTVDELTVKTHTIVFASADGSPTGKGTKNDPISLDAAVARGESLGKNAIIVVQGDAGDIGVDQPLQLGPGQALLGGDSVVPLHSTKGITENFNVPGSRPTLVGTDSSSSMIRMYSGSQNEIFGLNLTGNMLDGIFGVNMERAIVKQTSIDPPVANGIELVQDGPGAQSSSFVHIEDNTIIGAGVDGILVASDLYDGRAHTQTVIIDHNTANSNGANGIEVVNFVGGDGTVLSQGVAIAYNTANANGTGAVIPTLNFAGMDAEGGIGIAVGNFAFSGGAISQGLAIVGNTTNYNFALPPVTRLGPIQFAGEILPQIFSYAGIGIGVANTAEDGTVSQVALIERNTANANSHAGIVLGNAASEDGFVGQQASVYKNFVSGNGTNEEGSGRGILAANIAYDHGTVSQALFIDGNTVLANQGDGVDVGNTAVYNAAVTQTGQIAGNTVENNAEDGVFLFNGANGYVPFHGGTAGETIAQSLTIANNFISANGGNGIGGFNQFEDGGTLVQSLGINSNTILQNDRDGIGLYQRIGSGATVSQTIFVDPNTIAQNDEDGIFIGARVYSGGTLVQGVTILNNTVSANLEDGIDVFVRARSAGTNVSQTVSMAGNTVDSNGGDALIVGAEVYQGAHLSQSVVINNNLLDNNRDDGMDVWLRGNSGATIIQSATIANNTITNTDDQGIDVTSYISNAGTQLTQTLAITGNTINNILESNGIRVGARVYSGAVLTQTVGITGNSINDVERHGIYVSLAVSAGQATQSLTVDNNTISDVRSDGIAVYTRARSGLVSQPVFDISNNSITDAEKGIAVYTRVRRSGTIIQGSTDAPAMINNNTISDVFLGIGVYDRAHRGALSQVLQIDGNSIASAVVGIYVSSHIFSGATANQQITIANNQLDRVSVGILARNEVFNGADVNQALTIANNTIDQQGQILGVGIAVRNDVFNGGYLTQGLAIQSNTIAHASPAGIDAATAGIAVYDRAYHGGSITQSVLIDANSVASNFVAGVGLELFASTGGEIGQNLTITNNNIGAALYAGIGMVARAQSGGDISQGGTISNNVVAGQTGITGGAGLVSFVYASRGMNSVTVTQDLLVSNNSFSNNENSGVYLKVSAANGAVATQDISFSGNAINNNGDDGVKAIAIGNPDSAVQTLTFVSGSGNSMSNNANYGVFGSNVNATTQDIHLGNSSLTGNGVAATGGNANFTNP